MPISAIQQSDSVIHIYTFVFIFFSIMVWATLVAQMLKNQPAMWETWVQTLGEEDPLEKGMATHSSILAWSIPWTEELGRLQSMELQRIGHKWVTNTTLSIMVYPRILSIVPCIIHSVQFSSVAQSCLTVCNPMNRSITGLPVHHQLPEFTQTHVHRVSDAIQPSHPLSPPSPPAPIPPSIRVNSSHEVAKVLEFQL